MSNIGANCGQASLRSLRDSCDCGDPSWPKVVDLGFSPVERLVLDLVRCNCAGYADSTQLAWEFGLSAAMELFGSQAGPELFGRVLAVSKAVRTERLGSFCFLTVRCCRITPDERILMGAVVRARQSANSDLALRVRAVVKSNDYDETLDALQLLGATCRKIEPLTTTHPQLSGQRPVLH
ncbi:MAG: hypothetical protein AAGB04_08965 [Pseudomonadota bacterium]